MNSRFLSFQVLIYWMDFSVGYGNEKRTASDEAVPLCGIVEDYRTIVEDFKRVMEFVEWLLEES